jgi:hypothetical protein
VEDGLALGGAGVEGCLRLLHLRGRRLELAAGILQLATQLGLRCLVAVALLVGRGDQLRALGLGCRECLALLLDLCAETLGHRLGLMPLG